MCWGPAAQGQLRPHSQRHGGFLPVVTPFTHRRAEDRRKKPFVRSCVRAPKLPTIQNLVFSLAKVMVFVCENLHFFKGFEGRW